MYNVLKKVQKEINKSNTNFKRTEYYNTNINIAWLKLKKYFKLIDFLFFILQLLSFTLYGDLSILKISGQNI